MTLFGSNLVEVEKQLFRNLKTTKAGFPEETQRIEWGLTLMHNLTQITERAVKDYPNKPNLLANHNLFARNRQLLLNAYICLLFSSYGTHFVILRTVLENCNLMRLFNKDPKCAFEWLSEKVQKQFSEETQQNYGKSGKHDVTYDPSPVARLVFDDMRKTKVKEDIMKVYGLLCNYTHPNFIGWQELVGRTGENEGILNIPLFSASNGETATGLTLYLMQLTFKAFVETFKDYLEKFNYLLGEWQTSFNRLMLKY